jgi:hypothetical protein
MNLWKVKFGVLVLYNFFWICTKQKSCNWNGQYEGGILVDNEQCDLKEYFS